LQCSIKATAGASRPAFSRPTCRRCWTRFHKCRRHERLFANKNEDDDGRWTEDDDLLRAEFIIRRVGRLPPPADCRSASERSCIFLIFICANRLFSPFLRSFLIHHSSFLIFHSIYETATIPQPCAVPPTHPRRCDTRPAPRIRACPLPRTPAPAAIWPLSRNRAFLDQIGPGWRR